MKGDALTTLTAAIQHMKEWSRAMAIDGPVTQDELDGIQSAIAELERFAADDKDFLND